MLGNKIFNNTKWRYENKRPTTKLENKRCKTTTPSPGETGHSVDGDGNGGMYHIFGPCYHKAIDIHESKGRHTHMSESLLLGWLLGSGGIR